MRKRLWRKGNVLPLPGRFPFASLIGLKTRRRPPTAWCGLRTPGSPCHDSSSSVQHGLSDRLRQRYLAEERLRMQVIITGFVNDPKQAMFLSGRVAERDVDLPLLKRCRVALIIDAHDQLF